MTTEDLIAEWSDSLPDRSGSKWCRDVTSLDYNWYNDMDCHRPDGTVFHTDYAGARAYLNY